MSFRAQWRSIKRQQSWSEKCENGSITVDFDTEEGSSVTTGCHCQRSYPQGVHPAECSHCNCWLNKCRLIHCHHCHCCVRCRRSQNYHCRSNFVGMQRSFEWPADQVSLCHCVCHCYRLITTRRLQWYYWHCSWRSGRLSFAIVDWFGVGDVPANKEVCAKQLAFAGQKEVEIFFCPLFYRDLVQILRECSTPPVLMSQTRSKMRCGFMF
jgi:hypothetical protein